METDIMATDLAKFFGGHTLPATRADLKQNLAGLSQAKNSLMGKALLKFTKTGQWLFGIDNTLLPIGTKLIVNPDSISTGYVAWWMGKPEGEIMQPLSQGPVDPNRLGPVNSGGIPPGKKEPSGKGWESQISADFITTDDVPLQMSFKTSSLGGRKALMDLAGEIAFGLDENPDRVYPVVELQGDSYPHPDYGTIHTPILAIAGWLDAAGNPVADKPLLGGRPGLV